LREAVLELVNETKAVGKFKRQDGSDVGTTLMIELNPKNKTDKAKTYLFSFGGKLLMGKKMPPLNFRSIFNPTHHSLPFLVFFLAVRTDFVRKCCGGNSSLSVIAKTAKNSGRMYFYASQLPVVCVTTPGCARASREKIHGDNKTIMVITRQSDYTPYRNASSISGDGKDSERQSLFILINP
jgi:hypothetical protein